MKKMLNLLALWLALFLALAVSYEDGETFCVIFPPNGRDVFGVSQRSILIFSEDEVSLIPQVHFEGDARDFGILVPAPALPRLSPVGASIFSEMSFLTQPVWRTNVEGCGCDENNTVYGPQYRSDLQEGAVIDANAGGVTVVYEKIVGTYQAVVLQATSAGDLTAWLEENRYRFNPADSSVLAEYVAQNWYFVAMKLDTSKVPSQIDAWWNASTSPARIAFDHEGTTLTYPLKISAISTKERAEVLVYTIGPHPMRFAGAEVEYANAVDENEEAAIAERYPVLYDLMTPGVFITKLRKTFSKAEMRQDLTLTATDDRREFRDIRYGEGGLRTAGVLLAALIIKLTRRRKQTK
jgi:hypothetical protein